MVIPISSIIIYIYILFSHRLSYYSSGIVGSRNFSRHIGHLSTLGKYLLHTGCLLEHKSSLSSSLRYYSKHINHSGNGSMEISSRSNCSPFFYLNMSMTSQRPNSFDSLNIYIIAFLLSCINR
jgi:hypothetical protein